MINAKSQVRKGTNMPICLARFPLGSIIGDSINNQFAPDFEYYNISIKSETKLISRILLFFPLEIPETLN